MAARARLLVIGGDAAGMSAASQARRRRGPDELEIIAVERGHYASYSACGIPYFVGGVVGDLDQLIARTPAEFAERGIDLRMRTEAVEIDPDGGRVRLRAAAGGGERQPAAERRGAESHGQPPGGTGELPLSAHSTRRHMVISISVFFFGHPDLIVTSAMIFHA